MSNQNIEADGSTLFKVSSIREETKQTEHITPKQSADTLFNFVSERKYIEKSIEQKKLSARYCKEDIKYLNLGINELAYPMKCFCDINMHKLGDHLYWYGYYGIAFSKQWGMAHGIQPIQYINPDSNLCKDFGAAFKSALENDDENNRKSRDYLALQLMYLKPYSGLFKNRNTEEIVLKCFTDECEWRFVPNVTSLGMPEIITEQERLTEGGLKLMSNSLDGKEESSLSFEYEDIKYIILEDEEAYHEFLDFIKNMDNITEEQKYLLISKILVWSEAKGDF